MAYRCPVCETPQVDAEHLANHLAFTAVIRGDDHEDWLNDQVPGWNEENPETLAPKVAEAVPEVEVPEFDAEHGHSHGGRLEDELARQSGHRGPDSMTGRGDLTDEAADVVEEARELTERKYDVVDAEDESADDQPGGGTEERADADSGPEDDDSESESE